MKKKRTTPYRFRIGAQSAKFGKAYDDELGRLRLAHRITELREKCGLTQAQLADKGWHNTSWNLSIGKLQLPKLFVNHT